MIASNPQRAPILTARMGYMPGSNPLGYTAHIGYMPGARALGAFSTATFDAAEAAGIDQTVLATLFNAGATDSDIQNLMNGTTDLDTLYAEYGITGSPASVAAATAATPVSAAPATSTAQVPAGSTLQYTVTVAPSIGEPTASQFITQFTSAVTALGLAVASSNILSSNLSGIGTLSQIQFVLLANSGFATLAAAQSALDGLSNSIAGSGNATSQFTLLSAPSGSSAAATTVVGTTTLTTSTAATPTSFSTWLENNALMVGLIGVGGLIAFAYAKK